MGEELTSFAKLCLGHVQELALDHSYDRRRSAADIASGCFWAYFNSSKAGWAPSDTRQVYSEVNMNPNTKRLIEAIGYLYRNFHAGKGSLKVWEMLKQLRETMREERRRLRKIARRVERKVTRELDF